jgi:hypothetical protein
MADPTNSDNLVFGEDHERCSISGRPYENGSGALSKEAQTANFLREAGRSADMPKPGEVCAQTGRAFDTGPGAQTRTAQSARFLSELPEEQKAERRANAEALFATTPAGSA